MEDLPLDKLQISGPTLASLLHRASAAPGDSDGLLFGHVSTVVSSTLSDASSSSSSNLVATVTSFVSSSSPNSSSSSSNHRHPSAVLLGWFSARRRTPLRPSMREFNVTHALSKHNSPCIFILLTTPFQDQLIHTHEYRAFQFRVLRDTFEPKTLDVVNLGPAFRGHYGNFAPSNSTFPALPCHVRGLGCDEMVEDDGKGERGCFEESERLGRLVGTGAASYTVELEDLYSGMIKKMEGLARLVEKSSARVLEQENQNMKLRYKVAGLE